MEELSVNLSSTTEVSFDGLDIFDLDGDLIDNILDDLDNEIQTVILSIIIHIKIDQKPFSEVSDYNLEPFS